MRKCRFYCRFSRKLYRDSPTFHHPLHTLTQIVILHIQPLQNRLFPDRLPDGYKFRSPRRLFTCTERKYLNTYNSTSGNLAVFALRQVGENTPDKAELYRESVGKMSATGWKQTCNPLQTCRQSVRNLLHAHQNCISTAKKRIRIRNLRIFIPENAGFLCISDVL